LHVAEDARHIRQRPRSDERRHTMTIAYRRTRPGGGRGDKSGHEGWRESHEEKHLEDELRRVAEGEKQGQLERQQNRDQPWQRAPILAPLEPQLSARGRRKVVARPPQDIGGPYDPSESSPPVGHVATARSRNGGTGDKIREWN